MATFYSTGYGGNYPERMTLRTVATINSQDPVTNKSHVTISAYAYYNYGQYTAPNPTDGGQSLRIDDVRVHSASKNLDYTGTNASNQAHLFTWSGEIEHNPDGTKTVELKVWQDCPGVTTLDYLSGTHNWTLTTIARASAPTVSPASAALGSAVTISTNRASTGFTHTLEYALGSQTGTIATGVTDSASWTLPLALANAMPNSTSGAVTITCKTYNGATLIGTKTTTMTATVPDNATFQPDATLTSITEATAAMAGAGIFLAGLTSLRVQSSASAKYGASVTQVKIEAGGAVYYGADITTAVINAAGTVPVKLTVTDSRGYTATHTINQTFAAVIAPTLSAGSVALGGQVTITTNRAATTLTHVLKYALGLQAGAIATGVGASHLWNPVPLSIANALPNAISGTVTITQETYNGANLLTTKTVLLEVTIPDNATFKPGAAITSIGEGASGLSAFTVRIQGKSKLLIATSATPKYGATITQIKVDVDGGTYYGSFTAGAGVKTANITTAIIPTAGAVTALLTVTDSRGYTNTHSLGTTVEPYTPPKIDSFTADRSPNDQGEDLSAPVSFTISPIANQNTKRYTLRYRPTGGAWTTLVDSTAAYSLTTTHTAAGILDANLSYEVELTVTDSFGSASKTISIKTAFELVNYRSTGKGIAFGKVSEKDAVEFALPIYADGHLQPIKYNKEMSFQNAYVYAFSVSGERLTSAVRFCARGTSGSVVVLANVEILTNHSGGILISGTSGGYTALSVQVKSDGHDRIDVFLKHNGTTTTPVLLEIEPYGMSAVTFTAGGYTAATKEITLTKNGYSSTGAGGGSALSAYPVGAIYLSTTATNPGSIFGGTWVAFGTGRTLVGIDTGQTEFNTVEKTGGHKNLQSHTHSGSSGSAGAHGHTASSGAAGYHGHTGSAAAAGYHNHTQHGYWRFAPSTTGNFGRARLNIASDPLDSDGNSAIDAAGSHTHTVTADAVGDHAHTVSVTGTGDHAHTVSVGSTGAGNAENLQPFITVYMWKRTA